MGRPGASGRSTKCHPWGGLKDTPLFSWLQAVPRGNNPRQGAGSAILSHEFTKVMFSLDVFPTFLRTSLTECYVLKVQLPTSRFPTLGRTMVSSRRERHFFRKLAFRLDERRPPRILGRGRAPTPGPRNLNENPSPEELSGKSYARAVPE